MTDTHYTVSSDKSGSQLQTREYIIPSQSLVWFHLVLHLKTAQEWETNVEMAVAFEYWAVDWFLPSQLWICMSSLDVPNT